MTDTILKRILTVETATIIKVFFWILIIKGNFDMAKKHYEEAISIILFIYHYRSRCSMYRSDL